MTIDEIRTLKRLLDADLTALIQEFERATDTVVFAVNTFKRAEGSEVSASLKIEVV